MRRFSTPRSVDVLAALAGLVAGGATLAAGRLVAAVVAPGSGPFLAIGETVVDFTPEWLKSFAISTFGENDKLALFWSMGVVLAVVAAAIGVLERRRLRWGIAAVALLGVLAALAAWSRAGAGAWSGVPSLVSVAVGAIALWLLVRPLRGEAPGQDRGPGPEVSALSDTGLPASATSPGRRRFLLLSAGMVGLSVAAVFGSTRVGQTLDNVREARRQLRLPTAADSVPAPGEGVALDIPGLTPFVTPNADFYRVDTALQVPRILPNDWTLRVHGMVDRPFELTFADLAELPLVERRITLTCVSNQIGGDLADNARWLGYPLRTLLERARPHPDADMVLSTSVDGFTASTPLEALTDERDSLLAIGMNGEPLPLVHGFPARMVVPGLYGYVSATKWVVDLDVTRFDRASAYWTERGWAERGPIKIASRIDVPGSFAKLEPGRNIVAGVAWAQGRGIDRVEVRVGNEPWQDAELAAEDSIDTWRQWSWEWDVPPGQHTLRVRATDGTGEVQTDQEAPPFPDGASGWHSVAVEVVEPGD